MKSHSRTRTRSCSIGLAAIVLVCIQLVEATEEPLVKQQQRPGTWSELKIPDQRATRQIQQNFYGFNSQPQYPANNNNNRPSYYQQPQRPYPYTVYPYDDAEDVPYYQQQPAYPPPNQPPPGYYRPPPYYPPPPPLTSPPTTTPASTPSGGDANPLAPIGYMLVDTYTMPMRGKSISVPRAYFTVRG